MLIYCTLIGVSVQFFTWWTAAVVAVELPQMCEDGIKAGHPQTSVVTQHGGGGMQACGATSGGVGSKTGDARTPAECKVRILMAPNHTTFENTC